MRKPDTTELLTASLSSFMNTIVGVERFNDTATIIVEYKDGDKAKPVRLLGFRTEAALPDSDIIEEGYIFFKTLNNFIKYN